METQAPPNAAIQRVRELQASEPERLGTQMKLAKATGLDQKSWSNYLRGACVPSLLARRVIARKLKIRPELWDAPPSPRNDPNAMQEDRKGFAGESESLETPVAQDLSTGTEG